MADKAMPDTDDQAYAREYCRKVFERVGVTPELRRVYAAYLENEKRRKAQEK